MIIIVGLGNLGKRYTKTRHNLGFRVVESLKLKVKSFSDWKYEKKFLAEISWGKIDNQRVILAKPRTFMNDSGRSVKKIFLNLKSEILNLFVVHDDIDLPLGKIKVSVGRGAAGHKGAESIIKELKTKNFVRFRIGICPPTKNMVGGKPKNPEKFVLQKFTKEEKKIVKEAIKKTATAVEFSLKEGVEKAMSKYNK